MRTSAALLSVIVVIAGCSGRQTRLTRPVTVPFELRGDHAVVEVSVNGLRTLLILDSGSGALVLDTAFARIAGVSWSRFMRGTAEGNNKATAVRIGSADSVRVGAAMLTNVRVAGLDLTDIRAKVGRDVQGTLGFELFERYVVAIDYPSKTITLYEPAEFTYKGSGVVLPITIERNLPVVQASIVTRTKGIIPARLHIDLGSARFDLRLSSRFVARYDIAHDTSTMTGVFGTGVGGTMEGQILRLPQLKIGTLEVDRPTTALSSAKEGAFGMNASTDGTIGVPVFRGSKLILDYAHLRAIVETGKTSALPTEGEHHQPSDPTSRLSLLISRRSPLAHSCRGSRMKIVPCPHG